MKDKIISLLLVLIIVLKLVDLQDDFSNAAHITHLVQESVLILLSSGLFCYLIIDIIRRSRSSARLTLQLQQTQNQVGKLNQEIQITKTAFLRAIDTQFDLWELTSTEREVALMLIKGYSVIEIATLRQKSEKTIGNQTSSVYRKADVQGRHELAGLFFEEIIPLT